MKHFSYVLILMTALFFSFINIEKGKKYDIYSSSFENVLGTSLDMKFSAQNETVADEAENVAIKEIKRLNDLLSSYDPSSAFSKWTKSYNEEVTIPIELKEVLLSFEKWATLTQSYPHQRNPVAIELICKILHY